MENFEKCTVAMLGGLCSQHVTGNTSWQNQPQSAIMYDYNMTVWILAGNYISFTIAAGLIRLHMPGVKKSRVYN